VLKWTCSRICDDTFMLNAPAGLTDLRLRPNMWTSGKGADGLALLAKETLGQNPDEGGVGGGSAGEKRPQIRVKIVRLGSWPAMHGA